MSQGWPSRRGRHLVWFSFHQAKPEELGGNAERWEEASFGERRRAHTGDNGIASDRWNDIKEKISQIAQPFHFEVKPQCTDPLWE